MNTCAVIPAAGRATRLNTTSPKIFSKITETETIWSILRKKLAMVDHINLIIAPRDEDLIKSKLKEDLLSGFVSLSLQAEPIGMGDAIFQGYPVWSQAKNILIVWGDQVSVSEATLKQSLKIHSKKARTVVLPLTQVTNPYVDYLFDSKGQLTKVRQSREGDICPPEGLSDVGTFVLSVSELLTHWQAYLKQSQQGSCTKELNFLPFLPFLSAHGWSIQQIQVNNTLEARGINTVNDLKFFQDLYNEIII